MGDKIDGLSLMQGTYSLRLKSLAKEVHNGKLFTPEEYDCISKWLNDGISIDLIEYALQYCTFVHHSQNFGYYNTVIRQWKSKGIVTVAEAMRYTYSQKHGDEEPEAKSSEKNARKPEKAKSFSSSPVRIGNIYIFKKDNIVAAQSREDGKVALYIENLNYDVTIDGMALEDVVMLISGNAPEQRLMPEHTPQESAFPMSNEQLRASLSDAYNKFLEAEWSAKVEGYTGSDKQKSYARKLVSDAQIAIISMCESMLNGTGANLPINEALTEDGLTAGALIAIIASTSAFFGSVSYAGDIIGNKDKITLAGLVDFGKKWMQQNGQKA